jgi:hypothetical protein
MDKKGVDQLEHTTMESDAATPASVTKEALRACRWHQTGEHETYFALSERLRALAKEADGESNKSEAMALNLLADLCGMGLDVDTGKGPFQPLIAMGGRRSLLPEDLAPAELDAVAALSEEAQVPSMLRARLADVAWLRVTPRAPQYARLAIDAYRSTKPAAESWFRGEREAWVRAIQLCRELGRDCAGKLAEIEDVLLDVALREPPVSPRFLRSVTELIASSGMARTKRAEIAAKLNSVAQQVESRSDWSTARELFIESSRWFARAGDDVASVGATSKAAEMWMREGDFYEQSEGTGYMMAGSAYEAAVQLLRSIPRKHRPPLDVEDRIAELRRRLRENHDRSLDAMESFSGDPVDLRALAETARKAVSGKDAWQALSALVRIGRPAPPSHWRDQATQAIKDYPLQALFSNSGLSRDGRLVARSPGLDLSDSGSEEWKKAVNERAVQSLTLYQSVLVQGGILPALDAMSLEHGLTEAEFVGLAERSPIVPRGRERIWGRALCAGYRRDFAVAAHLLAPQIEHLVRTHLVAAGAETRKLDASGIETEIGLSALMDLPEVEKIFGETMAFELRAVFCDAAGWNLRNDLAHGLLDDAEMFSAGTVYAWWFSLRLVMLPLLHAEKAAKAAAATAPESEAEQESGDT